MRKSIILAAAAFALGATVAAAQPKKDIGYDPRANAFEQLDSAVAKAAAEDKLVLLISGGDWCIWCHYLAAFLERENALDAALHEVFVVQKVYVGDENMNKEFFARLPKAAGAPHFWVLSRDGRGLGLAGHAAARGWRQELRPRQVLGFHRAMAQPLRGSLVRPAMSYEILIEEREPIDGWTRVHGLLERRAHREGLGAARWRCSDCGVDTSNNSQRALKDYLAENPSETIEKNLREWSNVKGVRAAYKMLRSARYKCLMLLGRRMRGEAPAAPARLRARRLERSRVTLLADRIDHIVLTVADIEATTRFYERALGLKRETFRGPDGQQRHALTFGRQKINLQDASTVTPTKAWRPTFGSGDFCLLAAVPLDDVVAHLRAEGIALEAGPVPRRGAHRVRCARSTSAIPTAISSRLRSTCRA